MMNLIQMEPVKNIQMDCQMLSFVGLSLINEYLNLRVPRIYYWRMNIPDPDSWGDSQPPKHK